VAAVLKLILEREHDAAHVNWFKAQAWAAAASSPGGAGAAGTRGSTNMSIAKPASADVGSRSASAIDDDGGVGGTGK
jgi:hypothetical protein